MFVNIQIINIVVIIIINISIIIIIIITFLFFVSGGLNLSQPQSKPAADNGTIQSFVKVYVDKYVGEYRGGKWNSGIVSFDL